MDAHARLTNRVNVEQDEVLGAIGLVSDRVLEDRLFEQLTDLLVEGMFLRLRDEYLNGELARDQYVDELAALAERCRTAGLLPLPTRQL